MSLSDTVGYIVSELCENGRNWNWWRGRIRHYFNEQTQQRIRPRSNATNFLDEPWDTLVVADGCRTDLFENGGFEAKFDDYERKLSNASATPEWLEHTFDEHGEIVYVSANPMVSRHCPDAFHELIEVWRESINSETSVVRPEAVTAAAIQARKDHPNKRLIVHYLQPHYPFIDYPELNYTNLKYEDLGFQGQNHQQQNIQNTWEALREGIVEKEETIEAYSHNLDVVMESIETLLDDLDERIVVTSDHGNVYGELSWPIPIREFGHPRHLRHKNLITVPWGISDGPRREIVDDGVISESRATDESVSERLQGLGYLE